MTAPLARFTQEEFEEKFRMLVEDRSSSSTLSLSRRPRAILLGGQSGAGKTTLHGIYRDAFDRNVIIITAMITGRSIRAISRSTKHMAPRP